MQMLKILSFTLLPCHLFLGHLKYLFQSPRCLLSRYGVTRILNRMVVDKDFYSWNACKYHYLHHCCFHIWNYFHGSFLLLKTYCTKDYHQFQKTQVFSFQYCRNIECEHFISIPIDNFGWTLDGSDESITEYLGVADGRILDVCSK